MLITFLSALIALNPMPVNTQPSHCAVRVEWDSAPQWRWCDTAARQYAESGKCLEQVILPNSNQGQGACLFEDSRVVFSVWNLQAHNPTFVIKHQSQR